MSLKRKAIDLAAAEAKKPKANASITSFFTKPKPSTPALASNSSSAPTSALDASGVKAIVEVSTLATTTVAEPAAKAAWDKEAWIAKLTAEQKELLKLEIETLHESWLVHLKEEVLSKSFLDLKRFLKKERESGKKIFPPEEDVYSW
jgi:uracil-DNA glycosylase